MAYTLGKTKTPGIFKRGSRYVFVYRANGKQKWESARTLEEARRAEATRLTDIGRHARREGDIASAGVRLRRRHGAFVELPAHAQALGPEVHVLPAPLDRLAYPKARHREQAEEGPPLAGAAR